ncbi:MAG: MATE family efflux transporter [Clostridia bacterium]|nr:MATE family efflux transporter [Clostridia bacterium]
MKIQLSDHFSYKNLIRFTLPSVVMMVFTSIYSLVDGFFVSNFVGESAFEAVNFIMPYTMILGSVGFMFGTGGCALVSKTLGEGNREKANKIFSLFIYLPAIIGVVLSLLGNIFIEEAATLLGATGQLHANAVTYGMIIVAGNVFYMLQVEFQSFFVTAEKPKLGLIFTVASGVTNIILDGLFVGLFGWGLVGAAVATVLSQIVGCVGPVVYFARENSSLLKLGEASRDLKSLLQGCLNGSSELMTNISLSVVGMLYNFQLLKYLGDDGLAAYGVLMYVNFIFIAVFLGYAIGSAPIIGYNYGANRHGELHGVFKKSLIIMGVLSVSMFILSVALAKPMSYLYVGYNEELRQLTEHAFYIYSFSFLFSGFGIFGSSFFTALNDGPVSAAISFLRTFAFQVVAVLILPLIFDVDGIWAAMVVAEGLAVIVTALFMIVKRKKYKY